MDLKKKLGIGVVTGALGLTLIGGGTWAAFNDVEETQNSFAAGTLDLVIGEETTVDFALENLKPGDYWTEKLVLKNNGSLDINQILTDIKIDGWQPEDALGLEDKFGTVAENTKEDFLSQFIMTVKDESGNEVYQGNLGTFVNWSGDITGSGTEVAALEPGESLVYEITFKFEEDDTPFEGSRLHQQNKYQGERADIHMTFEATQMKGEDRSND